MVFVYSFAVGGASGTATPMPNWALVSSENEFSANQSLLTLGKPHRTQLETQTIAIVSPVNILLDIIVTRSERNTIPGTITSTISTQLKTLSTSYLKGSWIWRLKYTFLFVVNLALSSFSLLSCGGDPIDQCATVFGAKMQSKFKRNKKLSKWPVEDVLLSIIGSFR